MQPDIVQTLLGSVYFDDFNTGGCTLREVFDLYVNAKTILKKKVHFIFVDLNPIRKSSIFKRFRRQKTFTRTKNVSINWTKTSDAFTFDLKEIRNKFGQTPTKQNILHSLASLFGRLGLLTPLRIVIEILIQDACRLKVSWDETLPYD